MFAISKKSLGIPSLAGSLGEASFQTVELRMPVLRALFWTVTVIVMALVTAPSIYLFLWAFKGTETVGVLDHASWRWFQELFLSTEWRESILYSVLLAVSSSAFGTIVLVVHFYFMRFVSPVLDRVSYAFVILSVTVPPVIYALALRILGASWNISEVFLVLLGNVVSVLPVQFFCLEAAQETLPIEMLHAGQTMGATHARNILFVYLPLLRKAVWTAFFVGFFFSFDELVIATFVIDSPLVTVPKRLWDQLPQTMNPMPAVISCLLIATYGFAWLANRAFQSVTHSPIRPGRGMKEALKVLAAVPALCRDHWKELATPVVVIFFYFWWNRAHVFEGVLHTILHFIAAVGIGVAALLFVLRREIVLLAKLRSHTDARLRKPLGLFIRKRLESLGEVPKELSGNPGVELAERELESFVSACFKSIGAKPYIGTDSNVPSQFYNLYRNYLDEHFNRSDVARYNTDARILFVSENGLEKDFKRNEHEFKRFYSAHQQNLARLLRANKQTAKRLAQNHGLPSHDLGIFGDEFVVFFTPPKAGQPNSRGYCVRIQLLDEEMKNKLREFLRRLNDEAQLVLLQGNAVTFVERDEVTRRADEQRLTENLR